MLDRTQWFLAGMSIGLSAQLSPPVVAAVLIGKVVQTAQTNSSEAAKKVFEEAEKLYQQERWKQKEVRSSSLNKH